MKKKIFQSFDHINNLVDSDLLEISVKQSRIQLCFDGKVSLADCLKAHEVYKSFNVTDIMAFDGMIFIDIKRDKESESKDLNDFCKLILGLKEALCSCPILEFVVSDTYIKVFLDVPHITVKDLTDVDALLSDTGIIQFNAQRPYLLYVRVEDATEV